MTLSNCPVKATGARISKSQYDDALCSELQFRLAQPRPRRVPISPVRYRRTHGLSQQERDGSRRFCSQRLVKARETAEAFRLTGTLGDLGRACSLVLIHGQASMTRSRM